MQEGGRKGESDTNVRSTQPALSGFETGGRRSQMLLTFKTCKKQGSGIFFRASRKESSHVNTLIFSLVRPTLDF